jgi:chromosome segregation and condensation protein ScpB
VATYRVLAGISYPPNKRAEIGDVVDDLPSRSIKWLLEAGVVEQVDTPKPKGRKFEPVTDELTDDDFDEEGED